MPKSDHEVHARSYIPQHYCVALHTEQQVLLISTNLIPLDLLDLEDVAARIGGNLLLDERSLAGVGAVEDIVDFLLNINTAFRLEAEKTHLEGSVLGLGNEHVDDSSLNRAPDREDDVELPLDVLQSNGVRKLVDHHGDGEGQVRESHSLGADLEREHLNRVQSLERRNTESVDGVEDEDECDERVAGGIGTSLLLHGDCNNGGSPDEGDAAKCTDHHGTTAEPVNEEGTGDGLLTVSI